MPTVNETIKALQDIVALNPKFGELSCIYSHDDEGNEYQGVIYEPSLCKARNEDGSPLNLDKNYRFLEKEAYDGSFPLEDCNCVIIN